MHGVQHLVFFLNGVTVTGRLFLFIHQHLHRNTKCLCEFSQRTTPHHAAFAIFNARNVGTVNIHGIAEVFLRPAFPLSIFTNVLTDNIFFTVNIDHAWRPLPESISSKKGRGTPKTMYSDDTQSTQS
nr:MAG TPA: hypothetical protein [Caudoviricetes sp.]